MSKRAVLYARVSGDDTLRDGRNLKGQLETCRKHAIERGWTVIAELAEDDRGASGYSFELPQLNQLLEMAREGKLDVVVVREIDRFSRRLAKQLIIETELKRNGVQVNMSLTPIPTHRKATSARTSRLLSQSTSASRSQNAWCVDGVKRPAKVP